MTTMTISIEKQSRALVGLILRRITKPYSALVSRALAFFVFATFLTACNAKLGSQYKHSPDSPAAIQETDSDDKKPEPKILLSDVGEYEKLPEEIRKKYEPPPTEIKVGDLVIKVGNLKFSNLVYKGNKKKISIEGQVNLIGIEGFSDEDQFEIKISRDISPDERKFIIPLHDIDRRKGSKVKLGALVVCGGDDEDGTANCAQAKVSFFVSVKGQRFTRSFETKIQNGNETGLTPTGPTQNPEPQPAPEPAAPPTTDPATPEVPAVPAAPDQPPPAPAEPPADPTPPPAQDPALPASPENPGTTTADAADDVTEGTDGGIETSVPTHINSQDEIKELFAAEVPEDEKPAVVKEPKPAVKKPKIINGMLETEDGTLRPINQARGTPNKGSLRNATDLSLQHRQMKQDNYFSIVHPGRAKHFGTYEIAQLVAKLGQHKAEKFQTKLSVGNISLKNGGFSKPHLSHQNGTDVDLGYPNDDEKLFPTVAVEKPVFENGVVVRRQTVSFSPRAYSVEKTLALLEFAFKNPIVPIDRIFMNQKIINHMCDYAKSNNLIDYGSRDPIVMERTAFWKKVFGTIQHVDGHGNHMHIRIKCTREQLDCREMQYQIVSHCQK